uniref:Odorant receptor n=1 Tax=Campoletis chlorideae TaxID=219166 RepID=A0A346D457_9HYME|nr:odorant receptor [Campoletis chlorideae]
MSRETPDRSPMVKYPILIFVCNGFWCPMWFSTIKKLFYHCYTVLSSFFISSFMLAQFIDTLVSVNTITGFVNNCITLMPTINALCKALNLLAKRQRIIKLMYSLDNEKFRSQNCRETKVLKKYRRLSRFISAVITVNTLVTLEFMVFGPIIKNPQLRRLPFGAWVPYDANTEISFWFTLMWEKISASAVGLANLANDVLSISIMMHISGQLDILSDRLINLADDNSEDISDRRFDKVYNHEDLARDKRIRDKFVDCLHHHILIFQLADDLQECFVWTFASQMLVSLTGTCTGAFQLARSSIGNSEFTTAALFIGCMISEAFLYCWFGNEVHLKVNFQNY